MGCDYWSQWRETTSASLITWNLELSPWGLGISGGCGSKHQPKAVANKNTPSTYGGVRGLRLYKGHGAVPEAEERQHKPGDIDFAVFPSGQCAGSLLPFMPNGCTLPEKLWLIWINTCLQYHSTVALGSRDTHLA